MHVQRDSTTKRNGLGILAAVLLLLLLFVGYRVRTFHYCVPVGGRPQARIVSGSETCGTNEEQLEWRRMGIPGRIRLAARTVGEAFGLN